jgi:Rod binding domain-containing protein
MAGTAPAQRLAAARKAAEDFEAMAIGQMLQPMFATVDTARGPFGGGDGEAAWKPLFVEHLARRIAAAGGLGLARPVLEHMLRTQEAASATETAP